MANDNETKTKEIRIDVTTDKGKGDSSPTIRGLSVGRSAGVSNSTFRALRFGSILQTWADVSKINYISTLSLDDSKELGHRSLNPLPRNLTNVDFDTITIDSKRTDSIISQRFLVNVTSLLNEDQLWGCFYNFPDLYDDAYSPVVCIRNIEDVPVLVDGVLTRDMVTACLSYLKRTPILGDYVYIKLDLTSKDLANIDVLQHYKYLVYLDLSVNMLTDLKVLSKLPYLQYLSVSYNRLKTVLDYETPQWFLTEVHYRYNTVSTIRDLCDLWSITVLDLSHNNIKEINGLQSLRYLRHLDLSFNHIQRLERLNHLRLLWLDVSYNNITSFEFSPDTGVWTLLHLEYLNLNENNLTTMKIFSGCTRIRELHAKNNRFSKLMEVAVHMRKLRRLMVLDLRSNPVCTVPGYKDVVINTFPTILHLDARDLDPVEKRTSMMNMSPNVVMFASRRLLRLLYIQQLSRSRVSPYIPPADTTDVPIVIIVGNEAVGKGSLARRLATECSSNIELALQHTTALHHCENHYKVITRRNFDDMLLTGDFLTYSEVDGESYGLSREQAFVKDGKVKLVTMDLLGALMLKLRGYRPYLILATYLDERTLSQRQIQRREARNLANEKRASMEPPREISTLQVLLSGRIIINGILNEILQLLVDDKQRSEFLLDSECSLMMDSETRRNQGFKDIDRIAMSISSSTLLDDKADLNKSSVIDDGLHSLYKEMPGVDEYVSDVCGLISIHERAKKCNDVRLAQNQHDQSNMPAQKSTDVSKSSTWKGFCIAPESRKSSKSVTFMSHENAVFVEQQPSTSGMMVDQRRSDKEMENLLIKSISTKVAWPQAADDPQNSDLWLSFLMENGLLSCSELSETSGQDRRETKSDDRELINQLNNREISTESFKTNINDNYEEIHRNYPGLFCDTVTMDNPGAAFKKMKNLIKNIVKSQKDLKPMIDIDFANMKNFPIVEKKLAKICRQIAPQRLFY